jgi:hypothetical protein
VFWLGVIFSGRADTTDIEGECGKGLASRVWLEWNVYVFNDHFISFDFSHRE